MTWNRDFLAAVEVTLPDMTGLQENMKMALENFWYCLVFVLTKLQLLVGYVQLQLLQIQNQWDVGCHCEYLKFKSKDKSSRLHLVFKKSVHSHHDIIGKPYE